MRERDEEAACGACRLKDDAPGYKVIGCNIAGHILVSGAFPRHPRAIRSTLRQVRRALSQWEGLCSSGIARADPTTDPPLATIRARTRGLLI
jgi:hypothetical protein